MNTKLTYFKLFVVFTLIVLKITMSSSSSACGSGSNNGTGVACGSITQSHAWMVVHMPPTPITNPWGTYKFDETSCEWFGLRNGDEIPWVDAMSQSSLWKFWVEVSDPKTCSSNSFNYNQKMCGDPVRRTTINGSTISYPGNFEAPGELLKVPVASNRAMRFSVTAITNCNFCICDVCPPYQAPPTTTSAWKFTSYKDYDAGAVSAILNTSSGDPIFSAGILQPLNSIYFDCVNSSDPDLVCN